MSLYHDSRMREQGRGVGGPTALPKQLRAIVVVLVVGALLMALFGVVSAEGGVRFRPRFRHRFGDVPRTCC